MTFLLGSRAVRLGQITTRWYTGSRINLTNIIVAERAASLRIQCRWNSGSLGAGKGLGDDSDVQGRSEHEHPPSSPSVQASEKANDPMLDSVGPPSPFYFFYGEDENEVGPPPLSSLPPGDRNFFPKSASPPSTDSGSYEKVMVDEKTFPHERSSLSLTPQVAPVRQKPKSSFTKWEVDDDDELMVGTEELDQTTSSLASVDLVASVGETQVELRELLDDNFLYIPEIDDQHREKTEPSSQYIPGQPLIPPGMTRYRVDVQYQGSDFHGWFRSTTRYRIKERRLADGSVERVAIDMSAAASSHRVGESSATGVASEGMQTLHFAKTILEEALAVAVDVPQAFVSVVASVIPETGVSVRRLPCHVDLPSEIEMPSRTILKRATMWLQERQQPLAILSCHPCRNQHYHARHSGVRRVYCYRILNRIAPPLFDAGFQWHVDRHLDTDRMQRFAKEMEGTKDYGYFADPKMANALRRAAMSVPGRVTTSYSPEHEPLTVQGLSARERLLAPKAIPIRGLTQLERAKALPTFNEYGQTVKTYQAKPREFHKPRTNLPTVRTIDKIDVVRQEDEVILWFVGRSFLRHQIRNMVSVLKAAGHGLWDEQELQHAFRTGFEPSRKKFERERLPAAPVHGLTLWEVEYPAEHRDDYVEYVDSGVLEEDTN